MAWTSPMTAVANEAFTAAQFNTHVRDNLLETAAAKAVSSGGFIVTTGANSVTQRTPDTDVVDTSESSSSTSYTNLATVGPSVTLDTGSKVLIHWGAQMLNNNLGSFVVVAPEVSGATTLAASDNISSSHQQPRASDDFSYGSSYLYTSLNQGTNTFTLKYKVTSGTGTWLRRFLIVIPF